MARRATNHEDSLERDDEVQRMKHVLSRLDTEHVENAKVVLEYKEVIRSVRLQFSCNSSVISKVRTLVLRSSR